MSTVEDVHKVDAINLDKQTDEVILNIFDHLDWTNESSHIAILEEKIKNYIKFVQSKDIEQAFPNSKGKKIKICVVAKYTLNGSALKFIASMTKLVTEAGLALDHSFLKKLK